VIPPSIQQQKIGVWLFIVLNYWPATDLNSLPSEQTIKSIFNDRIFNIDVLIIDQISSAMATVGAFRFPILEWAVSGIQRTPWHIDPAGYLPVMPCRSLSKTNRCSGSLGEGRKPKCA
jgi:hypothetical protein